jgi:fructose transport system permease protein
VTADAGSAGLDGGTDRASLAGRLQRILHSRETIPPLIVLVVIYAVFSVAVPSFFQASNVALILEQTAVIATIAAGQTLVILTAGIDLSVGSIMVLSSIVMAKLSFVPGPVALLLGFGVGAGCGLFNGLLVARLRLPPFIVTLGTLNVFFALNLWYSQSQTVFNIPAALLWTGNTVGLPGGAHVTYGALLMIVVFIAMAYILRYTAWGRHVYATGDDPEVARLSGIRVSRVLISVYIVAGLLCAVAGWIQVGRLAAASPQIGTSSNLESITAVVIGGTSLFGGRGSIVGSLIGAFIVGVLENGLALAGIDVLWQTFAVGVLVIVAVTIDMWLRRIRA